MPDRQTPSTVCPLTPWLKFLGRVWMPEVLVLLAEGGPLHFAALRRAVPGGVSVRMLSLRLKQLCDAGLVQRDPTAEARRRVFYALTPAGQQVDVLLRQLERALPTPPAA